MPNVVQRFARHFVKRLRRVASSTSSPPIGPSPGDVTSEEGTCDVEQLNQENEVQVQNHSYPDDSLSLGNSEQSDDAEPDVDDDVIIELEAIKSLRIEDALLESKKMQEEWERKPKATNVRRLMKELRHARMASEESEGAFEVEPCASGDDEEAGSDLSQWEVRFYKFDETSNLWKSMQEYGVNCVTFRITFPTDFPFSPPFIRLVSPYIENGFVMNGGAICLEVLTSQGWSSAYSIEALLVQVAAALAHGGAVVSKHQKRKQHKLTQKRAEVEFRRIIKIHNKYGWVKLEKDEG